MTWLLWCISPLFLVYIFTIRARGAWATPDALFVMFNAIATLGTLILVNPESPSERWYALMMVSGLVLFMSVSWLLRVTYRDSPSWSGIAVTATPPKRIVWALYWLSLAVSVAYYAAIGYINLVEAFSSQVMGGQYDVATQRLASYSGTEYYFPGYVNQFKNCLLPVLTATLIHGFWVNKVPLRLLKTSGMTLIAFIMLAGTGQRGPTVTALIVVGIVLAVGKIVPRATLIWFAGIAFAAFSLLTLLLQRQSDQLARAGSWIDSVSIFASAFWSRVVLENPYSGIAAWQYMEQNPIGFGEQWADELASLLPGTGSPSLAHKVFGMLYGTERGTAPESIWGGIIYNFGIVGGALFVIIWAILLFAFGLLLLRHDQNHRSVGSLEAFAIAGAAVSVGTWVAGSPAYLFNAGILAYLFLIWLARSLQRSESRRDGDVSTGQHNLGRAKRGTLPRSNDRVRPSARLRKLGTPAGRR